MKKTRVLGESSQESELVNNQKSIQFIYSVGVYKYVYMHMHMYIVYCIRMLYMFMCMYMYMYIYKYIYILGQAMHGGVAKKKGLLTCSKWDDPQAEKHWWVHRMSRGS